MRKEGKKTLKKINSRHFLTIIWAKRRKSLLDHQMLPSSFLKTIKCVLNESKTMILGYLWFEAYKSWTSFTILWKKPQQQKRNFFWLNQYGWCKNGFNTSIQREKNQNYCPVMNLNHRFGQIFTLQRFWCVFCGIRVMLFTMKSWNRPKASLRKDVKSSWWKRVKRCAKSGQNTSIDT